MEEDIAAANKEFGTIAENLVATDVRGDVQKRVWCRARSLATVFADRFLEAVPGQTGSGGTVMQAYYALRMKRELQVTVALVEDALRASWEFETSLPDFVASLTSARTAWADRRISEQAKRKGEIRRSLNESLLYLINLAWDPKLICTPKYMAADLEQRKDAWCGSPLLFCPPPAAMDNGDGRQNMWEDARGDEISVDSADPLHPIRLEWFEAGITEYNGLVSATHWHISSAEKWFGHVVKPRDLTYTAMVTMRTLLGEYLDELEAALDMASNMELKLMSLASTGFLTLVSVSLHYLQAHGNPIFGPGQHSGGNVTSVWE